MANASASSDDRRTGAGTGSPRTTGRARRVRSVGQVTAIEVDGTVLRIAQVSARSPRPAVTRVVSADLPFAPGADRTDAAILGRSIAQVLSKLQVTPGAIVMGIPRTQVVLRTLALPLSQDMRELAAVVHFQVGKDLPFRPDEAVIDFKVGRHLESLAKKPEGGATSEQPGDASMQPPRHDLQELLVAAVKREVVEFYERVAVAAGLQLSGLGLLPYANARCVMACVGAGSGEDEAFALVSVRPDEVHIDVIEGDFLQFSRGTRLRQDLDFSQGDSTEKIEDPAAPGEWFVNAATIETVRSLRSYSGLMPGKSNVRILVVGSTGQEPAVVQALAQRLSLPVTLLDPGVALDLPPESRPGSPGAIAAIGLGLGAVDPNGLPFDFLNPIRPAVPRNLRRIRILSGLVAAVVITLGLIALRSHLISQREQRNNQLAAELATAEKLRPTYRRLIQQSKTVNDWAQGSRNWLGFYAHLSAVLPPSEDVYLSSLSLIGNGTIRLTVQARSGEILARLDKQLRAAGYEIKPIAVTPGANRLGYEFRSTVELTVPEKLKPDLSKVKPLPRPPDDASLDPALYKTGGG
ncbi:MAG: hypothetical protein EXS36_16705 [Pedosphaera sp.]|nr:hypothetical protein [Pedosphaera sp.]